jgi:hypothetical protein
MGHYFFSVGGHWPGSLIQAWVMTRCGHDRNYFLGHDPRLCFEKYSLWRILELGILKISFRGVISYTIEAINIIQDFIFCVFEIFLGHDPSRSWPKWVMTQLFFWVMIRVRLRPGVDLEIWKSSTLENKTSRRVAVFLFRNTLVLFMSLLKKWHDAPCIFSDARKAKNIQIFYTLFWWRNKL